MDESRFSRRQFLAGSGLGLAASLAGCSLSAPARQTGNGGTDGKNTTAEYEPPSDAVDVPSDAELTDVYEQLIDSVAAVQVQPDDPGTGGTAWVLQDEYLVTNEHITVLLDEPYVWFRKAGWRAAEVVGMDRDSDLGVLRVENIPDSAQPLSLVEETPPVGTPVAAIGNPFDLPGSFTTGVISGQNRTIELPQRAFSIADGVQTDAALNPGNSGGPLVNRAGEVVGVVSAGQDQAENIGFAISAAMVERIVPTLIEDGEYNHTYLGVFLQDVTPAIMEAHDMAGFNWGVYVYDVIEETPADGQLQGTDSTEMSLGTETPVGGDIIVRMDDEQIQTQEQLSSFLALQTRPGDTIEIEVIRNGQLHTEEVTLAARDDDTL